MDLIVGAGNKRPVNNKKNKRKKNLEAVTKLKVGESSSPPNQTVRFQQIKLSHLVFSSLTTGVMMSPHIKSFLENSIGVTSTSAIDLFVAFYSASSVNAHILRPIILGDDLNEKYLEIKKSSSSIINSVQRMNQEFNSDEKRRTNLFRYALPIMCMYILYHKGYI